MNFVVLFAILVALDVLYLGVIQHKFIGRFFAAVNGHDLKLKLIPGVLSWALLAFGLYYFVLSRPDWTWKDAALFGLVVYGVYDLTNLATISKWTLKFTVADMVWGAVLMTMVAFIYRSIFFKN